MSCEPLKEENIMVMMVVMFLCIAECQSPGCHVVNVVFVYCRVSVTWLSCG